MKCKTYHSKSITLSKDNKRLLFAKINDLLGKETAVLPDTDNPLKTANDFSAHFSNKVSNIRNDISLQILENSSIIENVPCSLCSFYGISLSAFKCLTIDDLKILLASMNKKSCHLDPIPTWLLLECFSELSFVLLHIINKSLHCGTFPAALKKAVVKPAVKDYSGDRDSLTNYRPVSNIAFLSKLIEKAVMLQINEHLIKNNLYGKNQSGYRKFHSCETLNINMYDNILKDIDNGNVVVLLLLDMSSAFDTVDHSILLQVLKECYGITDDVNKWFQSYLQDRTFCVNIYNDFSEFICLLFGVPQGFILGPILFILYTKHLEHIALKHELNIKLYADDSQLYISFNPIDNCPLFCEKVNACLNEIKAWLQTQFLKLNEDKTKLILLSKPTISSYDTITLLCTDETIAEVDWDLETEIKSLGVRLDPNLDMNNHISYVRKFCIGQLCSWKRIATLLDEDTRLLLVKQIILSKLDYNNSLLSGLPDYLINSLQFVINCAIRFIYNLRYRDHVTPYIIKSHILPVKYRIDFKICLTVFNCLHDCAPRYVQTLLQWNIPTHYYGFVDSNTVPRTTQDPYLLIIPSDFGKRTRNHSKSLSH